jgi:hypothetical protein
MIGVKVVKFDPGDDGVMCDPGDNRITHVWMGESSMPGDRHIGEGKKWCIEFHSGMEQPATIYFDEVHAKIFKEKVNESLEGLK